MEQITVRGREGEVRIEGHIVAYWDVTNDDTQFVTVSDGTVLSMEWDSSDEIWRIERLVAGTLRYKHEEGNHNSSYSDIVTLEGYIRWVSVSTQFKRPSGE